MAKRWVGFAALLVACGPGLRPETYATPEDLLSAAGDAYERGKCDDASRGFRYLLAQLPARDVRATRARYLLAQCEFRGGNYLEAARQFRRVATDNPQNELAPEALLREGDSFGRMWKRPELDPTYGQSALSSYRELVGVYPNSAAADAGRERLIAIQDQFALKDLRTGEFYYRYSAFDSAIIYFRYVVQLWPESRHAPAALLRLVETYRRIGYDEEIRDTCAHLHRFYPEAPRLADVCPRESSAL